MKVLHVFKTFYPDTAGGIEECIRMMAKSTIASGDDARVLTLRAASQPRRLSFEGVEVIRAFRFADVASTGLSFEFIGELRRQAKWSDIIHFHYPWPMADLACLLGRIRRPYVVTYHSDVVKQKALLHLYAPLRDWFLRHASAVVATSPAYVNSSPVLSHLAVCPEVIPLGVGDCSKHLDLSRQAHWRSQVGTDFLLFVGVLRYYKGLHFLVEAAKGFSGRIIVVGQGPEEAALKEQAQHLGISNVVFVGKVSEEDKWVLLSMARAFVFPSHLRSEAFGVALIEAAMMAKPMISCEIQTGTTYVNVHEVTGLSVPPADPLALRLAMQRMWDNAEMARQMGLRARERYLSLFTADRMGDAYQKLYLRILQAGRNDGAMD